MDGPSEPQVPDAVAGERCLRLQAADGASAVVSRWGAQVLSWRPAGGGERLFVSPRAALDGLAPLRGGVPIVFPQFANLGPLPAHGFARDRFWTLRGGPSQADALTFELRDEEHTRARWPYRFGCEFTVAIEARTLTMTLRVANHDDRPLAFQAALHTYLRVDDLAALRIAGLEGARSLDRSAADRPLPPCDTLLEIGGNFDRLYPGAPGSITVHEPGRRIDIVNGGGFVDHVIWNPGPERGARINDLAPASWMQFLCLEAACVAHPASLPPGAVWCGTQRLTAS